MHKSTKLSLLFGGAFAFAAGAALAAAAAPVPAFSAQYRLLQNGSAIGTTTLTLAPGADGTWTFTTDSQGNAGLAALLGASVREVSTFRWVGDLPQCETYDYRMDSTLKKKTRDLRCDWQRHTVTVDDKGTHTFTAAPGTIERHTVTLALAAALAAGQKSVTLPVAVLDRVEEQHYAAQGRQPVTVPAGTFDAVRIARADAGSGMEAWFAPGKAPVPVKIAEEGGNRFTLELQRWSTR